jgi:hypothetical protein
MGSTHELIPLTVPEVRRLLLALAEPPECFGFRLPWVYFRYESRSAVALTPMAGLRSRT